MKVKCLECGIKLEKTDATVYKGKNYHADCVLVKQEREELHSTICRILKLKAPGPRIYSQIKGFREQGLTYSDMKNALVYFYEVKRQSTDRSNSGIGIVPFVYEEANYYFNRIEKKKAKIAASAVNHSGEKRVVIMKKQPIKEEVRKVTFDLENM